MSKKREEALPSVQKRLVCLQDSIKLGTEQLDYHSRQSQEIVMMRNLLTFTYELVPDDIVLQIKATVDLLEQGVPTVLDRLRSCDASVVQRLNRERLAEMLMQHLHVPQAYRSQVLRDLRLVTPEALVHFCQEMTHGEVPREASVPTLVVLGQQDPFFVRRSAYEVSRAIPGARTVMVPGSSDLWNLQAPDQFTETVQAWITDAPLPARLVPF